MLPKIAELCKDQVQNQQLIEVFKRFTNDPSKWVKLATFQYLGAFIASYQGNEISSILIDYYLNMKDSNLDSGVQDNDHTFHCAFNFPAVLLTMGGENWLKLEPLYKDLINDKRTKVRRTLSFSLHEIAKILGPERTEVELMPVLVRFLHDFSKHLIFCAPV